jgi:hypothetical protein
VSEIPRNTQANWKRTVASLRKDAERLKRHDFQVIEPDNLETAPALRHGRTPAIVKVSRTGVEPTADSAPDRPGEE